MNNKIVSFNALQFLRDHNIEHTTQGQKATRNRVQVHCPFCLGSKKYHLGIHLTHSYANCWRCGPHSILSVIKELLQVSWSNAYKIADQYQEVGNVKLVNVNQIRSNEFFRNPCIVQELKSSHAKYIENRNFEPELIKQKWKIQSSGPVSKYAHRIFIPIFYRNEIVSFQCRYTGTDDTVSKYMTCDIKDEKVFHKSILYGLDEAVTDTVIVVEGVTDVWRLGPGAVATFGINYTQEQVYQLSKYKNIYIVFDPERTAQKQADKLGNELAMLGKNVNLLEIDGDLDPGDLSQNEADSFVDDIVLGKY